MSKCARTGCYELCLSRCSICLREPYCSTACQRGDWKLHKLVCKTIKKLSHELQPYQEVVRMIEEIDEERPKKAHLNVRVLGHLVSFAEHQFGDRVVGRSYRVRINGDRIGNWESEILILMSIYRELTTVHNSDESLSMISQNDLIFPYYEKMLDLLKPWSAYFNSNPTTRVDSMDKDKVNHLLRLSSQTERNIALIYTFRNEFDLAENYCQISLSHARLYEGEEEMKTDLLCSALRVNCDLQ
jgi:hypothetical protein